MQERLPPSVQKSRRDVCVAVSHEERGLEKDEAGIPDAWRSAEEGKDELSEHRLDAEQESGVDEHAQRENDRNAGCSRFEWQPRMPFTFMCIRN